MKNYTFTLILENVHDNYPSLEDKLYKSGCDDALIHFKKGKVYLDFDRTSSSFGEAVHSAMKNIKDALVDAKVTHLIGKI